ncbi:MAG: nucleotide sugar dehydrogenase [Patescibacteria group bacterium]
MTNKHFKIGVVGLWHCGEIYSAGLAELGHEVIGIDGDKNVVANFLKNIPPLPEPGLAELLKKNRDTGRLRYTTDFAEMKNCDVVWITYDTPVSDMDDADMSSIYAALEASAPHFADGVLLVVSSQVPIGTSKEFERYIRGARPGMKFDYVYTPENLRLGEAVRCFMEPGRVVIGADSDAAAKKVEEIFAPLKTATIRMSPASAEMAKHALNAYLATSVSFINDIADICEKTGADVLNVARALRSDPRIGPKAFLDAGLGFSGGTLGRDLKALGAAAKNAKIDLPVIQSVYEKNLKRKDEIVVRLVSLIGNPKNQKIAIFGLTYKPGTKTLRRSRALEIAADLSKMGAALSLYDPAVEESELPKIKNASFSRDPYAAAVSAKAIVIVTPWPQFKELDFEKIVGVAPGAIVFDTANLLAGNAEAFRSAGMRYAGVGR